MDTILDKEYFHFQREDAPSQWQEGQTISIGSTFNPFFSFYQDHYTCLQSPDTRRVFPIRWVVDHVLEVQDGKAEKLPELGFYSYDPVETLRGASLALKEYLMLIREFVFEEVRREQFPDLPSRQKCIWVMETPESVVYWAGKMDIPKRLLKVRLAGEGHRASNDCLASDTLSLKEFRTNAVNYWSGEQSSSSPQHETLFEGSVYVARVVPPEEVGILLASGTA